MMAHDVLLSEGAIRVDVQRRSEIPADVVPQLRGLAPDAVAMIGHMIQEAM